MLWASSWNVPSRGLCGRRIPGESWAGGNWHHHWPPGRPAGSNREIHRAPGQQCRRICRSPRSLAVRAIPQGDGVACLLWFGSDGSTDERRVQVPQLAPLFAKLDLPQAGALAEFFHFACPAREQRRGQPPGQLRGSQTAFLANRKLPENKTTRELEAHGSPVDCWDWLGGGHS